MKKSIAVFLVILGMFTIISCQKDRICVCEVNGVEFKKVIEASPKKEQKDECGVVEASYKSQDAASKCELE